MKFLIVLLTFLFNLAILNQLSLINFTYAEKVKNFLKIASSYKEGADFIFIYVREAHPVDGWYIEPAPFSISNHQSLKERFEAAELLKGVIEDTVPIFVDNMKDEAALAYGAVPERLYIVRNGVVVYEGDEGPFGYSLAKMERSLIEIMKS